MQCDIDFRDMTVGEGNATPLGLEQQLCEILKFNSRELWSGHGLKLCVQCYLDLGDMTLCQGHGTTFGLE